MQKKQTPSKTKTNVPDIEIWDDDIEIWDDPEWRPALDALERWPSDPKPLAKLLRSGRPVPDPVTRRLGILLDPPWDKKGPILTLLSNKRYHGQTKLKHFKELIDFKKKIEVAKKPSGKLEAAIAEVQRQTGKSRSYLMKAWKFKWQDSILPLAKYNP